MIPEGYEKLAVVGIAWKGDYAADTAYKTMNAVYHEGSTYVALRDNPTGPPTDDNSNWQYLAKGFVAALLSMVTAKDTSGLMGTAGDDVGAQALMDAIANKVATELVSNSALAQKLASYVAKVDIVQTESTRPDVVPSSAYLKQQLDTQNSNLSGKADKISLGSNVTLGDGWIQVGADADYTKMFFNGLFQSTSNKYTFANICIGDGYIQVGNDRLFIRIYFDGVIKAVNTSLGETAENTTRVYSLLK